MNRTLRRSVLMATLASGGTALATPPDPDPPLDPAYSAQLLQGWHRHPIHTAAEAEAYAEALTTQAYGPEAARRQHPFHAQSIEIGWRITGSAPWTGLADWYRQERTGPLTLVINHDGALQSLHFSMDRTAPALPAPP